MSESIFISATRPRREGGLRRLRPKALPPRPALLQQLTAAEAELLSRKLVEPSECVYHPCFRRASMPTSLDELLPGTRTRRRVEINAVEDSSVPEGPAAGVLSAEQERLLFLRFNYCRYRVMRVLARHAGRRLGSRAVRELLRWEQEAQAFRADIVRANTSLVLAMARRSRSNGVEIGELISEGNLALLRCVDKFDAARGYKFSTYACRAILASFSRAAAKAARHRAQFPTPYDPAMERSDYLETRRELIEYECVDELKRILFENAAELSPVERRVLSARFSLGRAEVRPGTRRKTLDQVGDLLGVSKERVRQIQNQAMDKLRAALERRLLAAS